MAKHSLFRPFDLLFPIGSAVLALALGLWGLWAAPTAGGKAASAGMAVAFLAPLIGLYLWRAKLREHDFVAWGVLVRLGKKHRPDRQAVAEWAQTVVTFWAAHYGEARVLASLDGVMLVYVDQLKLNVAGMWAAGYNTGQTAVIGYAQGDWERSRSLTVHELSHSVLMGVEPQMAWETHHDYFRQKGLGH
jgi:hypothetical protein